MKKSLVAALTGALVVGATATTFAAANPFSDVPAGHWAYSSVTKLAQEGVIEGYGDGTFLGNRNITRYEMAQMIAKAMAKNPQGASKAELDKLAAEFHEELENLGVRVAELEKNADKIKWTGELRYRYWNDKTDNVGEGTSKKTRSQLQFRIFPTAEINDHWSAKARFTATHNMMTDSSSNDVALTYIFAEGNYNKFNVKLGRMPLWSDADEGLTVDDFFSGAQVTYGDKFKVKVEGGRWNLSNSKLSSTVTDDNAADYQGIELLYNDKSRFNIGAAYRHFKSDFFTGVTRYGTDARDANIWSVGAGYKFGGDTRLFGAYARNTKAQDYKKAFNVELAYKGANRTAGSWGVFAAYRYAGINVGLATTYDPFSQRANKKGVEFGATWSPLKNTLTKISYFHGKTLDTNKTDKTFFGRISFFF